MNMNINSVWLFIGCAATLLVGCGASDNGQQSAGALSADGAAQTASQGEHCGGNTANPAQCAAGFTCQPDPNSNLPFGDVGGTCQPAQ